MLSLTSRSYLYGIQKVTDCNGKHSTADDYFIRRRGAESLRFTRIIILCMRGNGKVRIVCGNTLQMHLFTGPV